jgi:hypothetical protein
MATPYVDPSPRAICTHRATSSGGATYGATARRSVVDPSLLLAAEALLDDILVGSDAEDSDRTKEGR